MARLASGLGIFFGEQWPEPVLVVAVRFLGGRGGAAIALMARGASELVGIVDFEQLWLGMADESVRVLVGLLFALGCHSSGRDLHGLARAHVAGFAAVDNVGFSDIDLDDGGIPVGYLLLQAVDLGWSEIDHVIGDVLVQLGTGIG